jgi:hypothetical protein
MREVKDVTIMSFLHERLGGVYVFLAARFPVVNLLLNIHAIAPHAKTGRTIVHLSRPQVPVKAQTLNVACQPPREAV